MLHAQILFGESASQVRDALGTELEEVEINGVTILRYSGFADSSADYVYLQNDKVVMLSQSTTADQSSSIETLFPEISSSPKTYQFSPSNRPDEKAQFFSAWYDKGVAVLTTGAKSDDQVLRTFSFPPMSETQFFALWSQSKYIGKSVSYVQVNQSTTTSNTTSSTQSSKLSTKSQGSASQNVIVSSFFLLFLATGILLIWIKRKSKKQLVTNNGLGGEQDQINQQVESDNSMNSPTKQVG